MPYVEIKFRGHVVLLDEADSYLAEWLQDVKIQPNGKVSHVRISKLVSKDIEGSLHRHLMHPVPAHLLVDHKNRNPLDNRRSNLRLVTREQNGFNRDANAGKKLPKGVSWHKKVGKYVARITAYGTTHSLGYYATVEEAEAAYGAAISLFHLIKET